MDWIIKNLLKKKKKNPALKIFLGGGVSEKIVRQDFLKVKKKGLPLKPVQSLAPCLMTEL